MTAPPATTIDLTRSRRVNPDARNERSSIESSEVLSWPAPRSSRMLGWPNDVGCEHGSGGVGDGRTPFHMDPARRWSSRQMMMSWLTACKLPDRMLCHSTYLSVVQQVKEEHQKLCERRRSSAIDQQGNADRARRSAADGADYVWNLQAGGVPSLRAVAEQAARRQPHDG